MRTPTNTGDLHRHFYAPLRSQPHAHARARSRGLLSLGAASAFACAMLLGISIDDLSSDAPDLRTANAAALSDQRLIDLRTEAFRAGLNEGLQQSCGRVPALSSPIAAH